jgi:hypothetical protein
MWLLQLIPLKTSSLLLILSLGSLKRPLYRLCGNLVHTWVASHHVSLNRIAYSVDLFRLGVLDA